MDRALRVAVTGGIGSGKSSVSALLAEPRRHRRRRRRHRPRGRAAGHPRPGRGRRRLRARVLTADGTLDRAGARRDRVLRPRRPSAARGHHPPPVRELSLGARSPRSRRAPSRSTTCPCSPRPAPAGQRFRRIVVVRADPEVRRAAAGRPGLDAADARRRIAAQATDARRARPSPTSSSTTAAPRPISRPRRRPVDRARRTGRRRSDPGFDRLDARSDKVYDARFATVWNAHADVAQLVAHHLAKVRVAGSNPVVRSVRRQSSGGGVAEWLRQGPAKPCTRVRFPPPPRKA